MKTLLIIIAVQNMLGIIGLLIFGIAKLVKYRNTKRLEALARIEAYCKEVKPKTKPKPISNNVLTYKTEYREYQARFEDGVVYAMFKGMEEFVIGYYDLELGGWKVRCASDKGEIATIDRDEASARIFFNRLGDIERNKRMIKSIVTYLPEEELERQHYNRIRNMELTYLCAEVFGSIIMDIQTSDVIATSTSNDVIGNAAAFTCLQYEVVMEGKYHDFYSPI